MKIGIIGTNWGRIHIGTFRENGKNINLLVGRDLEKTKKIANEEDVPNASIDPADLQLMDVIVIASPADTHYKYIKMFPDKFILCEKPLFGSEVDEVDEVEFRKIQKQAVYVNYAFPFLQSCRDLSTKIRNLNLISPLNSQLNISAYFENHPKLSAFFADIVCHQLYYLNTIFPHFEFNSLKNESKNHLELTYKNNEQYSLDIDFKIKDSIGIDIELVINQKSTNLSLTGGYNPENGWNFEPILCDKQAINKGEYSSNQNNDIWFKANCASVHCFLQVIEGKIDATCGYL